MNQKTSFFDKKTKSIIIGVIVWATTTHVFVVWYNDLVDYKFGNNSFCEALDYYNQRNVCIKMVAGTGYAALLLPIVFGLVGYMAAKRRLR